MAISEPPAQQGDVLVIGAGPAGLATAALLRRAGRDPVVIERGDAPGASWRGHYDRLHLHTTRDHSALPLLAFPSGVPLYPSREDVVAYLETYARAFDLRPRYGEPVERVWREGDRWHAATSRGRYTTADVVIATGVNRVPHAPAWPGQERFQGQLLHSAAYRLPDPFRGQRVLVVGMGNTGAELALDLAEGGAMPTLSVRGPVVVVPRDVGGRPSQLTSIWLSRLRLPLAIRDRIGMVVARRAFPDLEAIGLRRAPWGPVTLIERHGRLPVVDIGTIAAIRAGRIALAPGIAEIGETTVTFTSGDTRPFEAIILATGYRPGLDAFLQDAGPALNARGLPHRPTGDVPGLHFVGFAPPKAGMLREIARTAPQVVAAITRPRS